MNESAPSWPKNPSRKKRERLAHALTQAVKKEIRRTALDDSDRAAAKFLTYDHLGCSIDQDDVPWAEMGDGKPMALRLRLEYAMRIRRKFRPDEPPLMKEDELAQCQIANIINGFSEKLRAVAADCFCHDFLENHREMLGMLNDAPPSLQEARDMLEAESPGELERLYTSIINGTLGVQPSSTPPSHDA